MILTSNGTSKQDFRSPPWRNLIVEERIYPLKDNGLMTTMLFFICEIVYIYIFTCICIYIYMFIALFIIFSFSDRGVAMLAATRNVAGVYYFSPKVIII